MVKKKVLEVQDVQLSVLESFPPQLQITAVGTVPTGGWENAELIPYIHIQPPVDGVYDYDFVAESPAGIVVQVVTPIKASFRLESIPDNLKGVRIHASSNTLVALLNEKNDSETTTKEKIMY